MFKKKFGTLLLKFGVSLASRQSTVAPTGVMRGFSFLLRTIRRHTCKSLGAGMVGLGHSGSRGELLSQNEKEKLKEKQENNWKTCSSTASTRESLCLKSCDVQVAHL